jgi:hypothetical protein
MRFIIDCFAAVFNCVGDPGGPTPAPEINAASGLAAVALLLSIGAMLYRQRQEEQH